MFTNYCKKKIKNRKNGEKKVKKIYPIKNKTIFKFLNIVLLNKYLFYFSLLNIYYCILLL